MNAVEYCLLHGLKVAGPEHPALLSAGEMLSYGALERRVSQFAAGLREAGVKPSDRVGMLMLDTPDIVAMHLAAMAAGGDRGGDVEPGRRRGAGADSRASCIRRCWRSTASSRSLRQPPSPRSRRRPG